MKICSFLPSATEIVCALGLSDSLVAVTDRCDYPPEAADRPTVVFGVLDGALPSAVLDAQVRRSVRTGEPIYKTDIEKLRALKPDVILTQNLCRVCAPGSESVFEISEALGFSPEIVALNPRDIGGIFDAVKTVGDLTGKKDEAEKIVGDLRERIERVRKIFANAKDRPRVLCMEWLDPPYAAGHWVPEMVEIAGGLCGLAETGEKSPQISWDEIADFAPNTVVLMPCGFGVDRTVSESAALSLTEQWRTLPAVIKGEVYAVDSNSYFTRPSPRIADGIEIMAGVFHPDVFKTRRHIGAVLNIRNHTLMESFLG